MRIMRTIIAVSASILGLAQMPLAQADALNPRNLPATTQWVFHMDVELGKNTQLRTLIETNIRNNEQVLNQIRRYEKLSGSDLLKDLRDVTLYGPNQQDNEAVVLIHGTINKEQILNTLTTWADNFTTSTYKDYQILSWRERTRTVYACIFDPTFIALSQSQKRIEEQLDLQDKKTEALLATSPVIANAKTGQIIYIGGERLASLASQVQPPNPMLNQMDTGWISISEKGPDIVLQSAVTAITEQGAQQLFQSLKGFQAVAQMAAESAGKPEESKLLIDTLAKLTITVTGKQLDLQWPIPLETLRQAAMKAAAANKPATQPNVEVK